MRKQKENGQVSAMEEPTDRIDAAQAQAALDADKQSRAREFADTIQREGNRLKCDLIAVAEIAGEKVQTQIRIIAK